VLRKEIYELPKLPLVLPEFLPRRFRSMAIPAIRLASSIS